MKREAKIRAFNFHITTALLGSPEAIYARDLGAAKGQTIRKSLDESETGPKEE